jgi:hypothetical protein
MKPGVAVVIHTGSAGVKPSLPEDFPRVDATNTRSRWEVHNGNEQITGESPMFPA